MKQVIDPIEFSLTILEQVIDSIPGIICWKNTEGEYQGCNNYAAAILKLDSSKDIKGRTLPELMPKKYAEPLLQNDQEVINTNKEKVTEEVSVNLEGSEAVYLSRKIPLHDKKGTVVGMVAVSFDISNQKNLEKKLEIAKKEATLKIDPDLLLKGKQEDLGKLPQFLGLKKFQLAEDYHEQQVQLTKREAQCIAHLASGKTAKQIAKILTLSPRTVEFYLDKAKHKLKCHNQAELIAKTLECRLLNASILQ